MKSIRQENARISKEVRGSKPNLHFGLDKPDYVTTNAGLLKSPDPSGYVNTDVSSQRAAMMKQHNYKTSFEEFPPELASAGDQGGMPYSKVMEQARFEKTADKKTSNHSIVHMGRMPRDFSTSTLQQQMGFKASPAKFEDMGSNFDPA